MKDKKKNVFGKVETLISQDTLVEGFIEAAGTIRIDGSVKGGIRKAEGVIIGETGMVEGNIRAEGLSLAGRVQGNVSTQISLELLPGSALVGDIETSKLAISEGAHFDGVCTMIDARSSQQKSPGEQRSPEAKKSADQRPLHIRANQPVEEPT